MSAARRLSPQRAGAAATALAVLVGSAGCASPYRFSPHLDTRVPAIDDSAARAGTPLAGDLHLSLAALMDQRRLLWQAAGEVETMKTATAIGLIGLASVAAYRGLQGEQSRGWLTRAGLIASATYAGANWLEPTARQRIYLAGAVSLTCLALVTAPYEMPIKDYKRLQWHMGESRAALEELATALRLAGRYMKDDDIWWLARGGWNKLRWANRVLDSADAAMGNIDRAGPQLRDMTAMLASEVATQVERTTKDLTELPDALSKLKPDANMLIGSEVFPPPKKEDVDSNPPGGATEGDAKNKETEKEKATAPDDAQCPVASAPVGASPTQKAKATKVAKRSVPTAAQVAQYRELKDALAKAAVKLDEHLGPVTSFVQRVAAARKGMELPAACGASTVTLVPGKRDLVLKPGESFQYVLQGDTGKAAADMLGDALPRDVLDLSMPLMRASTAVRLTAGAKVQKVANTVVRISDSKGTQNFDINVKVCPGGA